MTASYTSSFPHTNSNHTHQPTHSLFNPLINPELPWARQADNEMDTKYPYVCHAEVNAILNKNSAEVRGCTLFVALFPCNDCAKIIIQR